MAGCCQLCQPEPVCSPGGACHCCVSAVVCLLSGSNVNNAGLHSPRLRVLEKMFKVAQQPLGSGLGLYFTGFIYFCLGCGSML